MKLGIVGAPLSGKSTLFELITGVKPDAAKYHSVKPQPGIVKVPDERLDFLNDFYNSEKKSPAVIEFLDFKGITLDKRTETTKSLLGEIRNFSDALVIVLKAFNNNDFKKEYEQLQTEFLFSDLEIIEKRKAKLEAALKRPTKTHKEEQAEFDFLSRLQTHLEEKESFEGFEFGKDEEKSIRGYQFLSRKPRILIVNTDDVKGTSADGLAEAIVVNAAIENEVRDLEPAEQQEFLAEFGISELTADSIIEHAFDALGLIRFYTAGPSESRAWMLRKGASIVEAAGTIHSDMAKGFIRAEVFSFEDLKKLGSEKEIKAQGKFRLEGKEYIVQDGDIIVIRFSN